MKFSLGVLALLAIGAVGCNKEATNNAPVSPVASENKPAEPHSANNSPAVAANNAPAASNNAPEANNAPAASNNAPVDPTKPDPKKPDPKKTVPPIPDPAPAGQAGWTKAQIEAKKITESVDAKMKTVKNMRMNLGMDFAVGKAHGSFDDACLIADQSRYLINYFHYDPKVDAHPDSFIVTMQNGKYATLVGQEYKPGRIEPDKDILKGWALNSTHYITSGIGTSKAPFTELITAAQKAKWKISVENKKFPKGTYQRVVMESPTEPKKRYELMVEPNMKLPVSFNAAVFEKTKISSALLIGWDQSDRPLKDSDLSPKVKTEQVKVMTPEEAAKKGIKIKP